MTQLEARQNQLVRDCAFISNEALDWMNTFTTPYDLLSSKEDEMNPWKTIAQTSAEQDRNKKAFDMMFNLGVFDDMPHRNAAEEVKATNLRDCDVLTKIIDSVDTKIGRYIPLASYVSGTDEKQAEYLFFPPTEDFLGTNELRLIEAHELIHWTAKRVGRMKRRMAFYEADGPHARKIGQSLEEITAEIGSYLVLAQIAPDTAHAMKSFVAKRVASHITIMSVCIEAAMVLKGAIDAMGTDFIKQVGLPDKAISKRGWAFMETKAISEAVLRAQKDAIIASEYLLKMGE